MLVCNMINGDQIMSNTRWLRKVSFDGTEDGTVLFHAATERRKSRLEGLPFQQ